MRIPFDSLDSTNWLAYADFCAEGGNEKVAKYAQRVGVALEKYHTVGVDPRMCIAYWSFRLDPLSSSQVNVFEYRWNWRVLGTPIRYYPAPYDARDWGQVAQKTVTSGYPNYGKVQWVPYGRWPQGTTFTYEPWVTCPAEFVTDPWHWSRFSLKFFATVVDRAKRLKL